MHSPDNPKTVCAVHSLTTKACAGEVTEVILQALPSAEYAALPRSLNLCQYHHQFQLMVWGIKKFFEVYSLLLNVSDREESCEGRWQEVLEPVTDDSRLCLSLPDELEFQLNRLADEFSAGLCYPRSGFEYLRQATIDLSEACLTDKQLIAVCMVFYGGVKKKRAAQAMKITSQALSDHIKAALKKIGNSLANI